MANAGDLVTRFLGDTTHLRKETNTARELLGGLGSFAKTALAVGGLSFGFTESVALAETQIQAERKLEAVLLATGNAAGFQADELKKLASERQAVTNFGDEATLSATAMLATFKEIKGDVFKGAIVAAQDLSAVMEQDLKSSVVQIGKALNDPIRGVTALRRVGVSFTEQQLQQIRVMQESGDVIGAQQIIIRELESEFGGAAEAMRSDMAQLKNSAGDIGEGIGKVALPAVKALADVTKILGDNADTTGKIIVSVTAAWITYTAWQKRAALATSITQGIFTGGVSLLKDAAVIAGATAAVYGGLTAAEALLADEQETVVATGKNVVGVLNDEEEASKALTAQLEHEKRAREARQKLSDKFFDHVKRMQIETKGILFGDEEKRRLELRFEGHTPDDVEHLLKLERELAALEAERDAEQKAEDDRADALKREADEMERIVKSANELAKTPVDDFAEKVGELVANVDQIGREVTLKALYNLAEQEGLFGPAEGSARSVSQQALTAVSGMDAITAVNTYNREIEQQRREAEEQRRRDEQANKQREMMIKIMQDNGVPLEQLAQAVQGGDEI